HRRPAVARDDLEAIRRDVPQAVGERVAVDPLHQLRAPGTVREQSLRVGLSEVLLEGRSDVRLAVPAELRRQARGIGALHPDAENRILRAVLLEAREAVAVHARADVRGTGSA